VLPTRLIALRSAEIKIGEKIPPNIELRSFPPLVGEKVPQIRTHKFFVTENQIVVVSPQNIVADIIKWLPVASEIDRMVDTSAIGT
jgi:hypothetical protein